MAEHDLARLIMKSRKALVIYVFLVKNLVMI